MAVSKYCRTNGYTIPDPKDVENKASTTKEKVAKIKNERRLIKDCPEQVNLTLTLELRPKEYRPETLIEHIEKKLITDLLEKYGDNYQVVANCLGIDRRRVYRKVREYNLLKE